MQKYQQRSWKIKKRRSDTIGGKRVDRKRNSLERYFITRELY